MGLAVSVVSAGTAVELVCYNCRGSSGAAGALTGALLNGANIGQIAGYIIGAWLEAEWLLELCIRRRNSLGTTVQAYLSQGWLEGVQGGNMFHGL